MVKTFEIMKKENMELFGFGTEVMKKFKVCDSCGTLNEVQLNICKNCFSPLSENSVYSLYAQNHYCCPNCNTVLHSDESFCPQCGINLK